MSIKKLLSCIKNKKSHVLCGLDPALSYIPEEIREKCYKEFGKNLKGASEAVFLFNKGIIDGLHDIIPAIKPQAAYYEQLGASGMEVFERTIRYAKEKGLYVIADCKRGDIGPTAACYAGAYLGKTDVDGESFEAFPADAVTVNAYLGSDGVLPFLRECEEEKMIFILLKTSNMSSGELQDLKISGEPVYKIIAEMVKNWGSVMPEYDGFSEVGAVVGATYPEQMKELREFMPETFFLVPGYGAQGATAVDLKYAFRKDGMGAIVNSSRGIMCAYKKDNTTDFAEAARKEALRMRDDILSVL